MKFALGPTIATTRQKLASFGGYQSIENRPADDLLVGRLIAEQGFEVELLPYSVLTVADYASLRDLFYKRLRWITVMRHMRPWGHFGLIFTHGLPWALAAVALAPSLATALGYLGGYFAIRIAMVWMIGIHGLKEKGLWVEDAADPHMGRDGLRDLAHQLRAQKRPLARRGILHSQRHAGAGDDCKIATCFQPVTLS